MKPKGHILLFFCLILCFNLNLNAQSVTETEIFASQDTTPVDLYSFISDPATGTYCYIRYDAIDNKNTIISNRGPESEKLGYVTPGYIKFDSKGNYYAMAIDYIDTSRTDYHLIVNGEKVRTFNDAEPYNMVMNDNDELELIIMDGERYKLLKYAAGGTMNESLPYYSIKPILTYASLMGGGEHESEQSLELDSFFRDKEGRHGYILSDGSVASLMFGDIITPTKYFDIDQYSFTYDKAGVLSYIAKYGGKFYEVEGREFVVQGDKEYSEFNYVSTPLEFTSNNIPVYLSTKKVDESKYVYSLTIGNEVQKVYKDKKKTKPGDEFTGGIYDIKVEGNNVMYVGAVIMTNPPDDYESAMTRSSIVVNGIQGKGYYDMGMMKGRNSKYLISYRTGKKSKDFGLLLKNNEKTEVFNNEAYNTISDYGFDPSGKIYYVGVNYGDYEKKIKDRYFVYYDDEMIGTYDGLIYQQNGSNDYSFFKFGKNGKWALIANEINYEVTDEVSYYNTVFIVTETGEKIIPELRLGGNKKSFEFVDNLNFTADNRLFYVGGMYDETTLQNNMYLMMNSKSLDKTYNFIQNLKFDETSGTVTFRGSRDNKIYDVTVKL